LIPPADLAQLPGRSNPIYLEGRILPLTVEQARQLDLRDGQIVQALVQARGEQLALLLRGKQVDVPKLPLTAGWQAGQSLNLQVVQTGANTLGLQPLTAQPMALAVAPFYSRLGSLLFRPPGQEQLASLMKPGVLDVLLQTAGRADLQAQWRSMQLSMGRLDPQAMAQAINRAVISAMGSESRLLRGLPAPTDDPKQLLRRLMLALSSEEEGAATGDAVQTVSRALDDIEASQVQTAQAQAQKELMINLLLPFADADPIELQFRRAPRKEGEEPPPLTVNVHSRSQDLGEVWLKTQLPASDRVDLTMWAVRESVALQAKARSGDLASQLAESGLALQSFQVIHGPRPVAQADWVPSGRGLVIDIRA
jgi:hypothetical protein